MSGVGFLLPGLALLGGVFFSYSFAGLAWPLAALALWSLTLPAVRRALRPRALLRFLLRPLTLLVIAVLAAAAVAALVGPFGFASSFNKVAASNTYGPVNPIEALGIWPTSNYRLEAVGGAPLPGLAGAVAVLALLVGVAWWVARRETTIPIALGASGALYLASLPTSGDYSQAKALMIMSPLAMLVAVKPLLWELPAWRGRAFVSIAPESSATAGDGAAVAGIRRAGGGGRRWCGSGGWPWRWRSSEAASTRASSSCARRRSGRPGTVRSCAPSCRSSTASRSSTRARTATPPTSCSAPTPTCRWSSFPTRRSPPTRKSRSTPATPTARSTSTPSTASRSTASPT